MNNYLQNKAHVIC